MGVVDQALGRMGLLRKAAMPDPIPDRVHLVSVRSDGQAIPAQSVTYREYAEVYEVVTWVHRCIQLLAQAVASVPVVVQDSEGEDVPEHQLQLLLDSINPVDYPGFHWQLWTIDMMLAGEAFNEAVSGSGGFPVELWHRRADLWEVLPTPGPYPIPAGYRWQEEDGSNLLTFEPGEVVHWMLPNPMNRFRGLPPIAAARSGIVLDIFAQTWSRKFFENSARPDLAIEAHPDKPLTKTQIQLMEVMWEERFKGVEKAHKPAFLEAGQKVHQISSPPKDVEWLVQRKASREEICAIFGVPLPLAGDLERATYENIEQARQIFWADTVVPLLSLRDSAFNEMLVRVRYKGQGIKVISDLSDVKALQEDENELAKRKQEELDRGALTINEYRAEFGLEPVSWGDQWWSFRSMKPVGEDEPEPEPQPDDDGAEDDQDTEDEDKAVKSVRRKAIEFGSPEHEAMWTKFLKSIADPEEDILRQLKKDFQKQQNAVTQGLRAAEDAVIPDASQLFDVSVWNEQFQSGYGPLFADVYKATAWDIILDLSLTDPEVAEYLLEQTERLAELWAEERAFKWATDVNDTTFQNLTKQLAEGAADGESIPQLMERIGKVFEDAKGYRAERIARTEVVGASNAGSQRAYEAAEEQGLTLTKTWLAALDERTRSAHIDAHGQTVPTRSAFDVGGQALMYPGDPNGSAWNTVNCRCTTYANVE